MVDKVLINNIEKYELSFFKIAMQLIIWKKRMH